jgi:hypothetical protein
MIGGWRKLHDGSSGPGLHSQNCLEQIHFGICLLLFSSKYFLLPFPNLDMKIVEYTKLILLGF